MRHSCNISLLLHWHVMRGFVRKIITDRMNPGDGLVCLGSFEQHLRVPHVLAFHFGGLLACRQDMFYICEKGKGVKNNKNVGGG